MILLISDTHNNENCIKRLAKEYENVKLLALIHLGDVTDFTILEPLKILKCEKYVVKGNNDVLDLSSASFLKSIDFDFSNPPYEIFVEDFGHIAIMHEPFFTEEYIEDSKTKYIFYGHTHVRENKKKNNKRIVNPGALSSVMNFRMSYALVKKDEVEFKTL
ncbi:MAG: YfcE family phosphodiesterase [bacterium]